MPKNERDLAMWCHLIPLISGLVGLGILGFIGPLVIMNSGSQTSTFVNHHATDSLNFQLSMLIYSALIFILGLITCGLGILLYIPLLVIGLVFEIIATIAAKKGKTYLYPITIRFVK
ncbi:DUF4870 domain-containing protein [Akkermansiaceae bacterium]|nr:DUF4870 domain-containing protein [Akkermansiaceae bacterium]